MHIARRHGNRRHANKSEQELLVQSGICESRIHLLHGRLGEVGDVAAVGIRPFRCATVVGDEDVDEGLVRLRALYGNALLDLARLRGRRWFRQLRQFQRIASAFHTGRLHLQHRNTACRGDDLVYFLVEVVLDVHRQPVFRAQHHGVLHTRISGHLGKERIATERRRHLLFQGQCDRHVVEQRERQFVADRHHADIRASRTEIHPADEISAF